MLFLIVTDISFFSKTIINFIRLILLINNIAYYLSHYCRIELCIEY